MFKRITEYLLPIWRYLCALVQSIKYLYTRKKSIEILNLAKKYINNTKDLEIWYKENNFKYTSEKIDISSLPWVVITKLGGDCDDFASLTYEILKDKKECFRAFLFSYNSGHAVVIVKEDNEFILMSNTRRISGFKTKDEAAKYFYGEATKNIFYLK